MLCQKESFLELILTQITEVKRVWGQILGIEVDLEVGLEVDLERDYVLTMLSVQVHNRHEKNKRVVLINSLRWMLVVSKLRKLQNMEAES